MSFIQISTQVFLADLMAKKYVEANLKDDEKKEFFGGRLTVRKVHNRGLAFGAMRKAPKLAQNLSFAALTVTALRALAGKPSRVARTGYALLIGGALSNWFDRFHQGFVTDYLHIRTSIRKLSNLYFNLADAAILIGGLLTLIPSGSGRREKLNDANR